MVDSIEQNVESAQVRVQEGTDQLRMAETYKVGCFSTCWGSRHLLGLQKNWRHPNMPNMTVSGTPKAIIKGS
jgi:hypothetical protein